MDAVMARSFQRRRAMGFTITMAILPDHQRSIDTEDPLVCRCWEVSSLDAQTKFRIYRLPRLEAPRWMSLWQSAQSVIRFSSVS